MPEERQQNRHPSSGKRQMKGVIVSTKMKDTVIVAVTRRKKHPLYRKHYRAIKRYKAHSKESYQTGDMVTIEETRPLSREKRWRVIEGPQRGHPVTTSSLT